VCPAPVRTLGCAATRRSPALTGRRVDGSWVSPSPGTSPDAALVRCRVTSHGLSLRRERGGGVSAGLLHFPAGNAARWRHQAHRITEQAQALRPLPLGGGLHRVPGLRGRKRAWLFRGSDLNRSYAALSRPAVSPTRPRNRHPQSAVALRIPGRSLAPQDSGASPGRGGSAVGAGLDRGVFPRAGGPRARPPLQPKPSPTQAS
jgi:hypothetical protein